MARLRTAGMEEFSRIPGAETDERTRHCTGRTAVRGGFTKMPSRPRRLVARMREPRGKIVATVGPASRSLAAIAAMARAGADVFRVNGAHEGPTGTSEVI